MDPSFDGDVRGLIAAYGDLQEDPPSQDRIQLLGGLVMQLLTSSGIDAVVRPLDVPAVAFRHDGRQFLMGLTWTEQAMDGTAAAELTQSLRTNAPSPR